MFAIAFIISPGCQRKELLNSSGRPSQFTGEGNRLGWVGLGFQPGGESHRTPLSCPPEAPPDSLSARSSPTERRSQAAFRAPGNWVCLPRFCKIGRKKKKGGGKPGPISGPSQRAGCALDSPSELGGAVGAKAARCSQRGAGTRRRPRAQAPPLSPGRSLLRSQLQPLSRPSTEPRERGSSQPGG